MVAYCYCWRSQRNLVELEKMIMQILVTHADPSFLWLYSFAAACFCLSKDNQLVQSGLYDFNTSNFTGYEVCWLNYKLHTGYMESCTKLDLPEGVKACNVFGNSILFLLVYLKFCSFWWYKLVLIASACFVDLGMAH